MVITNNGIIKKQLKNNNNNTETIVKKAIDTIGTLVSLEIIEPVIILIIITTRILITEIIKYC